MANRLLMVALAALLAAARPVAGAPVATATETELEFKTYPFSDPDPVPATRSVRYPYFFFDGTAKDGVPRRWKAVILENDRVRVTMLPEIGGKVWGAEDKITGRAFIYYNHVVKFRNIAQRGPWCSGGIEFNFGLIGHGPWTATPVSYCVRTNADGSVSYFASETELATLTTWQVEVNLAPGAEGFTTRTVWFNGSGFPMPYYHWMNAAYPTRGNPSFEFPGAAYIGHAGDSHAWPIDPDGHDLSKFTENAFGSHKSAHVLNGDNGVYGIWWPGTEGRPGFGSAHVSHVTQKYGRKVWLWAQSRSGAIWEDLLTDTDGQYTELQSGRAFNQPAGNCDTPFKHPTFAPGLTDTFEEEWRVVRDRTFFDRAWNPTNYVTRPQRAPADFRWDTAYGHALKGEQLLRQKFDREGERELRQALTLEPHYVPALNLLATLAVRWAAYGQAHAFAARALAVNTYEPEANYADGLAFMAEGRLRAARERLGLAAYSPVFRSAALVRVAQIEIRERNLSAAKEMVAKAVAANALDFDARLLEVVLARLAGDRATAAKRADALLAQLPLLHAARYELNLADPASEPFARYVRNELPQETFLSIGEWYEACGLDDDAARFFALAAERTPIGTLRLAHLRQRAGAAVEAERLLARAAAQSPDFAFPFRRGSLPALQWAADTGRSWKFRYWQAVLLASFARDAEADALLDACGNAPDAEAFYLYRASRRCGDAALADLRRAAACGGSWRTGMALFRHFADKGSWAAALKELEPYIAKGRTSNKLNIAYARALVGTGRNRAAIAFLERTDFLPSEGGDDASAPWIDAWRALAEEALAKGDRAAAADAARKAVSYPERLGKGRPYELDFTRPAKGRNPLADWPEELRAFVENVPHAAK